MLEELEDRSLLAVSINPGANVNISKITDNQAESTIAVYPGFKEMGDQQFAASMTFHGSMGGTFDPLVNVPGSFQDHAYGMYVAYSTNAGSTWAGRMIATSGQTGANKAERDLPAALADPQAAFDSYGNLYLTYLSGPIHAFGNVSAQGPNTLTDNTRQWTTDMWAGRVVWKNFGQANQDFRIIQSNTADTLTVTSAWGTPWVAGDTYRITSPGPANAVVALYSTDGGQSFKFLRFLDAGNVDYPTVATGPGRNPNEQSVWFAWKAGNGNILAAGTSVTGKDAINKNFVVSETVTGPARDPMDPLSMRAIWSPRAQVDPNGQVMVTFHTGDTPGPMAPPTTIYVNVDADGLGPNGFLTAPIDAAESNIVRQSTGQATIPAQPNQGIAVQANLAWDRSGAHGTVQNGRVYLVYTSSFNGINGIDTDIYVKYSDDAGATWSARNRVSGNDTNSQFFPAIAVDQSTGKVAVIWLDARNDPANVKAELYATVSVDGGQTWEPPVKIAVGQSNASNTDRLQRGTTTGGNADNNLKDTNQNWVLNNYWRSNFKVTMTAGGAFTETRAIDASSATQLTVNPNWPMGQIPAAMDPYEIRAAPNPNVLGAPPFYRFNYGDYLGLAFQGSRFFPIWSDNSNSTGDNPNGANKALDLYTAQVSVMNAPPAPGLQPPPEPLPPPGGTSGFSAALGVPNSATVPIPDLLQAALILAALPPLPNLGSLPETLPQFEAQIQVGLELVASQDALSSAPLLWDGWSEVAPSGAALDSYFQPIPANDVLAAEGLKPPLE